MSIFRDDTELSVEEASTIGIVDIDGDAFSISIKLIADGFEIFGSGSDDKADGRGGRDELDGCSGHDRVQYKGIKVYIKFKSL